MLFRSMAPRHPLVIGHRGAPAHRPEHTLASYVMAAGLGADYLEPDLVATADGVLVARHEPELGGTTDIATRPEFADRHTTRVVDGRPRTGWFVDDLTLAELRTLQARERLPVLRPGNTRFDGRFPLPTFAEILDLRARLSAAKDWTNTGAPGRSSPAARRSPTRAGSSGTPRSAKYPGFLVSG